MSLSGPVLHSTGVPAHPQQKPTGGHRSQQGVEVPCGLGAGAETPPRAQHVVSGQVGLFRGCPLSLPGLARHTAFPGSHPSSSDRPGSCPTTRWALLTPALPPQVHSKDKKYVCKVCSRVFMSAASVGIRHGSRRHGVCADCAGRGMAGPLDHGGGGGEGSPEALFPADGPYLEDPDDPRGEVEELGEDDEGLAPEDALLADDKDDEDSPRPRSPPGGPDKDFAWLS
ncbi:Zinc finger and BTB domain-containing protein 46 [Saguinus oedipus]|uniref:Zinc finger and BTB domain-containing protein 46 n=1 Tax=Saguinus oedipus TaxID=9490 RepID=A0ABQ9VLX9_SAGOE|nr:Zinc finger and BTB domain-containing protein 46 [Saguinus oedipus]